MFPFVRSNVTAILARELHENRANNTILKKKLTSRFFANKEKIRLYKFQYSKQLGNKYVVAVKLTLFATVNE